MKTQLIISIAIILIGVTSCSQSKFIQVYKTKPISDLQLTENQIVFSDYNCTISYNFWGEGGDAGFTFHNKSNQNISLNLNESFFVLNGFAFDYFKNRVFMYLDANVNEKPIIIIPPNTSKQISEYYVSKSYTSFQNLKKIPGKGTNSINFNESNSPFIFQNIITYSVNNETHCVVNEFYVFEISNHAITRELEGAGNDVYGNMKYVTKINNFSGESPDSFYIIYGDIK